MTEIQMLPFVVVTLEDPMDADKIVALALEHKKLVIVTRLCCFVFCNDSGDDRNKSEASEMLCRLSASYARVVNQPFTPICTGTDSQGQDCIGFAFNTNAPVAMYGVSVDEFMSYSEHLRSKETVH